MKKRLLTILLMLPAMAGAATFPLQADNLVGLWFSKDGGEGNARASVLRVTNVLMSNDKGAALVAYFGSAESSTQEAKDVFAKPEGDGLGLALTTHAGGKLVLHTDASGALSGEFTTAKGKPVSMRFEKTQLASVHQWLAENPRPDLRARKDSVIELLYLSADNCGYCRAWEKEYLLDGRLKNSPEWGQFRFTEVKRMSFNAPVRAEDMPPHLQPVIEQYLKGRTRALTGSPWFVVVVNGKMRINSFGVNSFESLVAATIRSAVRERSVDGRAAATHKGFFEPALTAQSSPQYARLQHAGNR